MLGQVPTSRQRLLWEAERCGGLLCVQSAVNSGQFDLLRASACASPKCGESWCDDGPKCDCAINRARAFLVEPSRVPTCKLSLQAMADLSFALFMPMLQVACIIFLVFLHTTSEGRPAFHLWQLLAQNFFALICLCQGAGGHSSLDKV